MAVVVLWADNWEQMLDFYKSLLGANVISSGEHFTHLAGGGNEVMLHLVPEEFRSTQTVVPLPRTEMPIKPVFLVDSLDGVLARGFHPEGEAQEFAGWSYLDLVDPDGNVISVRTKA